MKWMLGSDTQFPYHDARAVDLFFKVMKWFKPDAVDLVGDIDDQDCYSRYTEGRPAEFANHHKLGDGHLILPAAQVEAAGARDFYEQVRKTAPNADVHSSLGNHDIRVFDYFDKKLPEYAQYITPESLWGLDNLGITYTYYDQLPKHRFGDIFVHHGVAISQNSGESVKKDVENWNVSLVRGHSHRIGDYFKTYELRSETVRGYEIGHLSDETNDKMMYTNVKNWQKGFAIAHVVSGAGTKDGLYPHIQTIHITQDYTCVVDGKVFKG
jgi:hypothetical protein